MTSSAPSPPRLLGRYALHGEIASGGMAAVHLGRLLGPVGFARTVAIKRLHPQFAKDPAFVAMFLDEARLAARIRHPNVVPTLDVVTLEDELFLVMEYVHGESLARLIRYSRARDEQVPIEVAAGVMSHALHGLHAAHEAKSERGTPLEIVHRDVSPQNVLVGTDGIGRVLDFGIAKATSRLQVTVEGQLKGKLAYMAPEQLERHDVDRRVDVWAAAVVLWELLVSRRLFTGDHPARLMKSVLSDRIPKPSEIVSDVPPDLEAVVMRGLSRDPDERFATARDMAVALEATGCVATQHAIGAWVERVAIESLSSRADLVADIEGSVLTGPGASIQAITGMTPPATSAPAEGGTLAATLQDARELSPRRRKVAAVLGGAALVLFGGVAAMALRNDAPPKATPAAAPLVTQAPEAPAAKTHAPEVVEAPAPSPVAASATAPAPPPPTKAPHKTPKTSHPKQPSKPGCDPPYTVDKDGVKIPKLHCL